MLWGLNRAERLPCLVGFCYSLCFSDNFGAEKLYWTIVGKLYINLHLERKSRKLPRVGTAKPKRRQVFISQVRSISLLPELTLASSFVVAPPHPSLAWWRSSWTSSTSATSPPPPSRCPPRRCRSWTSWGPCRPVVSEPEDNFDLLFIQLTLHTCYGSTWNLGTLTM